MPRWALGIVIIEGDIVTVTAELMAMGEAEIEPGVVWHQVK